MARLFLVAWGLLLLALPASWPWLPELAGSPGKQLPREAHLAVMFAVTLTLALLSEPALRWVARRWPERINLPHRDHWLAPERREASLATLAAFNGAVGLLVLTMLGGIHLMVLLDGNPQWPQPPAWFWLLGGALVHLGLLGLLIALFHHFGRPPKEVLLPSRRPRRPNRLR